MKREIGYMKRDAQVFSANLDRLMTLKGMRNIALAEATGVSRQMVSNWRLAKSPPSDIDASKMAAALGCTVADLDRPVSAETIFPMMIPITQWAAREKIPVGRAKNLFAMGFLQGSIGGNKPGEVHLVPYNAHAPDDSKRLIRSIKRPRWVMWFAVNLTRLMDDAGVSVVEMRQRFNIGYDAVRFWRIGRSYPHEHRLPEIAALLNCSVDDLIGEPTRKQIEEWSARTNRNPVTGTERGVHGEDIPLERLFEARKLRDQEAA